MDLLLDINVAVGSCTGRKPWCDASDLAITKCQSEGGRLWLYVGSVQTLEYVTRSELKRMASGQGRTLSERQLAIQTRNLLQEFVQDKHWLAALAGEGAVFDTPDPKDAQLLRALNRFPAGSIRLLTRDGALLNDYPDKTISPLAYCQMGQPKPDFIDLAAQQNTIRPQLEQNLHRVLHHGQYILGPEVGELEEKLADYTGAKYCITCANGTDARDWVLSPRQWWATYRGKRGLFAEFSHDDPLIGVFALVQAAKVFAGRTLNVLNRRPGGLRHPRPHPHRQGHCAGARGQDHERLAAALAPVTSAEIHIELVRTFSLIYRPGIY